MKWMKAPRDGSSNWMLERESIPRYKIWSISFVCGTARHVRHVLVCPFFRRGAATRKQGDARQQAERTKLSAHCYASREQRFPFSRIQPGAQKQRGNGGKAGEQNREFETNWHKGQGGIIGLAS